MRSQASAAALKAGHPQPFDTRPAWLKAVDGDEAYAWARMAWDQAAAQPGAWFDHQLADGVVADWPNWATLTLARFAGVKFKLAKWQEITVRLLVGWMTPIEELDPETHQPVILQVRLFKRLMLWIPRKNGKSEFLAALALLFFAIDGESQGEGYIFARKEDQARIVFNRMAAMVANNPEFKEEIAVYSKTLYLKTFAATFFLLSGSAAGAHGKMPSVIVGDEMHEWRSLALVDTLRQGTGGRLQAIELYASTAGRKSNGLTVGEQLYDESLQIADGRRLDASTLVVLFAANDNDDAGDEAAWRRANPNLGLSPTLQFMRREYSLAVGNPRKLAEFKCYHLGIWAESQVRWLPPKKWDACNDKPEAWKVFPETLKGRRCFGALDVSATTDLTAWVLVFPPDGEDPKWRVICRFWLPELQVERRVEEGAPVDKFIDMGALTTTSGDYVDQNVVGQAILESARDYQLEGVAYDSWNAAKLITDLQAGDSIHPGAPPLDPSLFHEIRQGIRSLCEPSKHFERLVFAGLFDHGGHPVLKWMAANVVVQFDVNLNFMPAKAKSVEKIDGIMASVMAVGLACAGEEADPSSPWDDPNFTLAA